MSAPTTTLQAAVDAPLDLDILLAAITPAYAVEAGPRRSLRRTSLDTFDGLLRAAGLRLEHHRPARGSGEEHLLLTRADGSTMTTPATALAWPAMPASLPGGPLRDAVAAAATIRALMVAREESRRVRRLEVRNDEGKIVVRLDLDEPVAAGGRRAAVSVRHLRGYADQARRVERLLTSAGLTPAEEPSAPKVAASAPTDLPEVVAPDRDGPPTQLLVAALIGFQREMDLTLPGTIDDVDSEFLHDFRVAVRRTRATLKLGRPALPEAVRTDWEPAFKWLGDLTTPVRDLDVYELDLPRMAGWLVAADASDLDAFAEHLRRRRTAERTILVRTLRSARYRTHRAQWAQLLTELTTSPAEHGDHGDMTAGELADAGISKAYQRVAKDGGAITADSPAQDLHDLRKRCKELRYALEVFAPVLDSVARKAAVTDLKGLQDVLGRFQDTEVQRHALRDFAEEMVTDGTAAGAVLAMGEMIGHLDAEQARARAEFAGAFTTFVRPAGTRRMQQLGGRT